jgi:hypothetical protein
MGRGRLILGLETVQRFATVQPTLIEQGYQVQVVVGRDPVVISPWLPSYPSDAIRDFGRNCRATGITKIADVARHTIETAKQFPDERITMAILGDCFDEDQEEIYSFAPQLEHCGVRVIMAQDTECEKGTEVYQELARRITHAIYIDPLSLNNPLELEKVLRIAAPDKLKVLK